MLHIGSVDIMTCGCSGYAAVSARKQLVIIDNAANGFTLYRLDRPDPIRTYITEPPTVLVPKQVAFGEDVKIVVGGSDNGTVYLFDRKSGELLEMLHHASSGLVQSITVSIQYVHSPVTHHFIVGS